MTINYEINPPKIHELDTTSQDVLLEKTIERVSEIAKFCDGIHVTESVLGIKRLSPIITGGVLKRLYPKLKITVSMRTMDRDINAIENFVDEVIASKLDGILVLKGDPSKDNPMDSGLAPSHIVRYLREKKFADKTRLFLSIHNKPDFDKIKKKIDAGPVGFVTQVVHSVKEVSRICDRLSPEGFQIIPIVLLPSEKNTKSANFLNLDWSNYIDEPGEFIRKIHNIAGDVLITSPNDFGFAKKILKQL